MRSRRQIALLAVSLSAAVASVCPAQSLPKANRILLERGLQIQGMATKDDVFHLDTYKAANYTAINWLFDANPAKHGPPPGFPWARWVSDQAHMPPVGDESAYMPNLVAMSLGDEKNLNDPAVRDPYVAWFNAVTPKYPNAIIYANNYGGQVGDAALGDFIDRAKPDMIVFDTYPWVSDYKTRKPAPPPGGSPTSWYSELRRYRAHALAHHIPFGTYRQSFHAEQDYDQKVYRDPSTSEFRLNTFGALAFNCKYLIDFTYNTGASSFFTKPGGDSHPTPLYAELALANRQARNLGQTLVRLKPIAESPTSDGQPTGDSRVTSMMFIRGKHAGATPGTTAPNDLPVGFAPDRQAADAYSDWESNRNDPYLRGWDVANTGTQNAHLPGDVILSWFTPLDESLDGDTYSNEIYLMVTNGLSALNATPAATHQRVTLYFADAPATQSVQTVNPTTGRVDEVKLPLVKTRRQLVLELDGGSAALFKFNTGAPFVK